MVARCLTYLTCSHHPSILPTVFRQLTTCLLFHSTCPQPSLQRAFSLPHLPCSPTRCLSPSTVPSPSDIAPPRTPQHHPHAPPCLPGCSVPPHPLALYCCTRLLLASQLVSLSSPVHCFSGRCYRKCLSAVHSTYITHFGYHKSACLRLYYNLLPLVGRFNFSSTIYSEKCCLFFRHFSPKKMVKFSKLFYPFSTFF
jgi:hypothetical protein